MKTIKIPINLTLAQYEFLLNIDLNLNRYEINNYDYQIFDELSNIGILLPGSGIYESLFYLTNIGKNIISEIQSKEQYRVLTMDELYDYAHKDIIQNTFSKPKFPSRRWGHIYTKDATTNYKELNFVFTKLKQDGFGVKLIKEKNKFYSIQIKNHPNRIC